MMETIQNLAYVAGFFVGGFAAIYSLLQERPAIVRTVDYRRSTIR